MDKLLNNDSTLSILDFKINFCILTSDSKSASLAYPLNGKIEKVPLACPLNGEISEKSLKHIFNGFSNYFKHFFIKITNSSKKTFGINGSYLRKNCRGFFTINNSDWYTHRMFFR